jgi:hypothetical protein
MHGLRPDEILKMLKADIDSFAGQNKAQVSIAKDPWNVLEILSESPSGFRVILHWAGDKQLGDWDDAPLATANIEVVIGYAIGLSKEPGQELITSQFNTRPSVLKLVSDLRERVLTFDFDCDSASSDEAGDTARYVGCDPIVLPDGTQTHAYKLKFELDHALPEFTVRSA